MKEMEMTIRITDNQQLIEKNKIQNVGSDQKYDIEKILELKPDVIFTNYIETFENTYKILQNNGIKIIFLDEYLEEMPLDKAAYLKLFGKLLGEEKRAEEIYTKIKNDYESIKQKAEYKYSVSVETLKMLIEK